MSEGRSEIVVVFGRKGTGKTTFIRELLADRMRVLIHDPMFEFGEEQRFVEFESRLALHRALTKRKQPTFRYSLRGPDDFPEVPNAEWLAQLAEALRDVTIVFDEMDYSFSANTVPQIIKGIISYSRHYGINIIAGARRPASVPRILTSQADRVVSFRTTEPNDLKYLKDFAGAEFAEGVSQLEGHDSLEWTA